MVTPVVIWLSVVGAVSVLALGRAIHVFGKRRQLRTIAHRRDND